SREVRDDLPRGVRSVSARVEFDDRYRGGEAARRLEDLSTLIGDHRVQEISRAETAARVLSG
ncbi:MAG TPA: hypothetical protein VK784_09415, partial [Pseudonocardiaceae bacterium]|nr:hypothetical protein [Pseudonocardiaceae bacterium]